MADHRTVGRALTGVAVRWLVIGLGALVLVAALGATDLGRGVEGQLPSRTNAHGTATTQAVHHLRQLHTWTSRTRLTRYERAIVDSTGRHRRALRAARRSVAARTITPGTRSTLTLTTTELETRERSLRRVLVSGSVSVASGGTQAARPATWRVILERRGKRWRVADLREIAGAEHGLVLP